jgi:hypothetical protein
MTTQQALERAAALAKLADTISARFQRTLAAVLRETERRLDRLMPRAVEGSRTAQIQAGRLSTLRGSLRDVLTAAGFDRLASDAGSEALTPFADRVLIGSVARMGAEFAPNLVTQIATLESMQVQELLLEGDDLARALWQATTRGILNSQPSAVILSDLATVLDDTKPHIETLYDTNVSIFGRQVEALSAGDAPETRFAYLGPVDEKTRDFCLERVGKVFTREEIDAMDNEQLDNVFLTGGGYNCRHVWMEVSRFSELYDLQGRVPEVQDQLNALDEAA